MSRSAPVLGRRKPGRHNRLDALTKHLLIEPLLFLSSVVFDDFCARGRAHSDVSKTNPPAPECSVAGGWLYALSGRNQPALLSSTTT
jgi:hypothetical protein